MEDLFVNIEGIFNAQMTRSQFIAMIAGSITILCGLFIIALSSFYPIRGQHVLLKVMKLHQEERKIKEDDDEDRIAEKKANPLIRPEFEIIDGQNAGILVKSSSADTSHMHELGEVIPGYYFVKSGDAMSKRQSQAGFKFGLIFIAVGMFVIILFNFVTRPWTG